MNKNIKYILLLLIVMIAAIYTTSVNFEKKKEVKTIDTVICVLKEYYAEDTLVGDKCLVIVEECDTIYKTN